jgi:hypothetical protein
MARVRVSHGMVGQKYYVVHGCLLSLSFCRRGFQDLFHIPVCGLHVGRYPFTTCFLIGPTSTLSSLLPIDLSYFQAKPSPLWIPKLFSNLVIFYLLVYEDETECSETSVYKIQKPRDYPEENIQITFCLRSP